jgi:acyl-CoA synthetase (AMP-forming)/AMP-acid ligase II
MFWEIEKFAKSRAGLYDAAEDRFISYAELIERVAAVEKLMGSSQKLLVALMCDNSAASIVAYLATLRAGHAVLLTNSSTDASLKRKICGIYAPEIVLCCGGKLEVPDGYATVESPVNGLEIAFAEKPNTTAILAETAVLLSTSGTTGSPKLVRLSYRNIQANAESIVQYLAINADETAITSLPLSYSYGLSVLNSHLLAGASLACTNASVVTKEFWSLFTDNRCTSFAGVPFSYGMLEQLRFERMNLPSLRTMTQAGGRLAIEKAQLFGEIAQRKGFRFFVMYGQTEATARISYVPWERLTEKAGAIGIAIPGGSLRLVRNGLEVAEPHVEGEIVYSGPNVMLGYAETRACLAKKDELDGTLHTGDLGYRDAEGFYYLTGRLKRFIKVFGLRLNLDEVEKMIESALRKRVACAGQDENLHVIIESGSDADVAAARGKVISLYKLHHSAVHVARVDSLPVTAAGKKNYTTI